LAAAAAAALLAGCMNENGTVNEEVETGKAISFRVQGSLPSTYTLPSGLADMDGFTVNGWVDNAATQSDELFFRKSVVRDATTGVFTYSPTVYFPKNATSATFAAYSPINVNTGIGSGGFALSHSLEEDDNKITYTVPNPGAAGGTLQKDLLVACAVIPDVNAAGASVALHFKHALALVNVFVTNSTNDPLIIKDLVLVNIGTEGSLDIDADKWLHVGDNTPDIEEDYVTPTITSLAQYKVLWDNISAVDSMRWLLPSGGVVIEADNQAHEVTTNEQAMLVMPQTTRLTSGAPEQLDPQADFHLLLAYSLNNLDGVKRIAFGDINTLNEGLTFEMGKQYNLNLVFSAKGVSFSVDVEDWTVESPVTGTL